MTLVVQWLRPHTPNAGGMGSIPGGRTKVPYATRHSQHTHTFGAFLYVLFIYQVYSLQNWVRIVLTVL